MLGYSMTPTGTQININGKLCAPLSVTDQYLGICLYRNGFDIITPHCISELGRKKRMVVFDDTGDLPMPGNKNNFIKKLTIVDNYKSGSDIGRMLLDLGHRTVAFVAPYHRNQWSIDRYNGLTETFRLAGITAGIKLVGDPNAVYDQDFAPEPANWLKSNPEFKKAVDQLIAECRKSLGAQSRVTDRLSALTYEIPIRIREQHLFKSCFDTAFNLSGVSAWVCMNDTIAIAAMEYLRSRNKQVPADISLTGFDDSPEGFAVGLTSYNFNHTGASQTMLTYLFSPHESYFGNLKAIPHEGFIANRTSVARV